MKEKKNKQKEYEECNKKHTFTIDCFEFVKHDVNVCVCVRERNVSKDSRIRLY